MDKKSFSGLQLKKETIRHLILNFMFFGFFYSIMFIPHYSIDSFNVSSDVTSMITAPLTSGRAIFALWGALFKVLSFNPVTGQFFGMLVLVGSCAVGHCILYQTLSRYLPPENRWQRLGLWLALFISFANPFIAEWFFYVEMAVVYSTAILCSCAAVYCLSKPTAKNWILATVLVIISTTSYQVGVFCFLIWGVFLFSVHFNFQLSRQSFACVAGVVGISAFSSLLSLVIGKVLPQLFHLSARFSEFSLSKSLVSVLKTQPSFWKNTLRMMPPFFVAVVVILFLVSIAFSFGAKKRWLGLVWALVLLIGCYISSFAVHIISPVVWVVPRSTVPFFCFVSIVAGFSVLLASNRLQKYLSLLTLVVVVVCYSQTFSLTNQQISTNRRDSEQIHQIVYAIEQYEQETGIAVNKISWNGDAALVYVYPGTTLFCGEVNQRVLSATWALDSVIEFYTGRDLTLVSSPQEIKDYFAAQNWNGFDLTQQLIFDGDTVHFCCY